jgi:hypothetical protein
MSEDLTLDDDVELSSSNIGKRAYFIYPHEPPDRVFTFSSTIENIGIGHDRQMKNHTEVTIISDSESAFHPNMGPLVVIKVMSTESMWVPITSLVIIDDLNY